MRLSRLRRCISEVRIIGTRLCWQDVELEFSRCSLGDVLLPRGSSDAGHTSDIRVANTIYLTARLAYESPERRGSLCCKGTQRFAKLISSMKPPGKYEPGRRSASHLSGGTWSGGGDLVLTWSLGTLCFVLWSLLQYRKIPVFTSSAKQASSFRFSGRREATYEGSYRMLRTCSISSRPSLVMRCETTSSSLAVEEYAFSRFVCGLAKVRGDLSRPIWPRM
jgi:hypothetical protein